MTHLRDNFSAGGPISQVPASWFNAVAKFINGLVPGSGIKFTKNLDGGATVIEATGGGGGTGTVTSVDGVGPNSSGNVTLNAITDDDVGTAGGVAAYDYSNVVLPAAESNVPSALNHIYTWTGIGTQNAKGEGVANLTSLHPIVDADSTVEGGEIDLMAGTSYESYGYLAVDMLQNSGRIFIWGGTVGTTNPFIYLTRGSTNEETGIALSAPVVNLDADSAIRKSSPTDNASADSHELADQGWVNSYFARKSSYLSSGALVKTFTDSDGVMKLASFAEVPTEAHQSCDRVLTVGAGGTTASWSIPCATSPTTKTTITNSTSDSADTTSWSCGAISGLSITQLTRVKWTGSVLYGYYRTFTYDAYGRLYLVTGETREVIDTPVQYSS